MKSIKPGRGSSMMSMIGSIAAGVFGLFWMVAALQMGAPVIFALFGLIFIAVAVSQAVFHYRNATQKDRYSLIDIVDAEEEADPLAERFAANYSDGDNYTADNFSAESYRPGQQGATAFCPYCGSPVAEDYVFCKSCGQRLPE